MKGGSGMGGLPSAIGQLGGTPQGGMPPGLLAQVQGLQGGMPQNSQMASRTMGDMRLIAGSHGHPENIRQVSSGPMGHGAMPGMGQPQQPSPMMNFNPMGGGQQPIDYASRAGRMRNAGRHVAAMGALARTGY